MFWVTLWQFVLSGRCQEADVRDSYDRRQWSEISNRRAVNVEYEPFCLAGRYACITDVADQPERGRAH